MLIQQQLEHSPLFIHTKKIENKTKIVKQKVFYLGYLFRVGTVHIDGHLHVNMPDCSQRLVYI